MINHVAQIIYDKAEAKKRNVVFCWDPTFNNSSMQVVIMNKNKDRSIKKEKEIILRTWGHGKNL